MSDKKLSETFSYKVGWFLGERLVHLIAFIFKIIYLGTVKACMTHKRLIFIYITLIVALLVTLFGDINSTMATKLIFFILLGTVIIFGLFMYYNEYPVIALKKEFKKMFTKLKFTSKDEAIPSYVTHSVITPCANSVSFYSLIPLSEWTRKKELFEMHLNRTILDIKQDNENNRIFHIILKTNELPNYIKWNDDFLDDKDILNIGVSYYGIIGMDIIKYPHAFVTGETNCGKSSIIKTMIHQALCKDYNVKIIDFKRGVSFSYFEDYVKIYYDYVSSSKLLSDMVDETNRRLDLFREEKCENINEYNKYTGDTLDRIVIFIDELAELLNSSDKKLSSSIYNNLETLTRLSRAVGINLIMGIQRPDSTIVTGQIKNNVSFRICGRYTDKEPSRIMLGSDIASNLKGIKGRFIIKDDYFFEVQAFYYDEEKEREFTKYISSIKEPVKPVLKEENKLEDIKTVEKEKSPVLTEDLEFDFSDIK